MSLVNFRFNLYMMLVKLLPFKIRVPKTIFENFVDSRDNIDCILVDEDQAVPDPWDNSLSMISTQ